MSVSVFMLKSHAPEWKTWLARTPHDIFHTPEYHKIAEASGEGEAFLIVYADGERFMAWPYLLREIGEGDTLGRPFRDVASVYGYPGPLFQGCEPGDSLVRAGWAAIREIWRSQHVVSAFTRFHPLLGNHRWMEGLQVGADISPQDELMLCGHTISINTAQPAAEIEKGFRSKLRQQIARSRREGISIAIDSNWDELDVFLQIYWETMERNGAPKFYFFDAGYFRRLREMAAGGSFLMIAMLGNRAVAALLVLCHGQIAHAHLGGTQEAFLKLSPFKVIFADLASWAHTHGFTSVHLGGGRGSRDDDSLFRFKSEFSDLRHTFYTGKWILNQEVYDALCARYFQGVSTGQFGAQEVGGYFPAYRASLQLARPLNSKACNRSTSKADKLMNILISSAGRRVALSACFRASLEALKLSGQVLAIDASAESAAGLLADKFVRVPRCTEPAFLSEVRKFCAREDVRILIPTIDTELAVYAQARQVFAEDGIQIVISDPETVEICADKMASHDWLARNGFPVPRQSTPAAILECAAGWRFPLIAKPRKGSASVGVFRIDRLEDLVRRLEPDLVVEEMSLGTEFTINVYVNAKGKCVSAVPHQRLEVRSGEVSKGVTNKHLEMMELASLIAERLPGARGPLNIQCFLSSTGDIEIIEINPRFGGGYPLAHRAGAPSTTWIIREALGECVQADAGNWIGDLVMLRYDEAVFVSRQEMEARVGAESVYSIRS